MHIDVEVQEAETRLSGLLEHAIVGDEVIIVRSGVPLVRLTPITSPPRRRELGTAKGEIFISDDFNDPLPEDILAAFEK